MHRAHSPGRTACLRFPDDHTAIDYRMDRSLPLLAATLKAIGCNFKASRRTP
jgi:hypothetical protein